MSKKMSERKIHLIIIAFVTGLFLGINFSFIASADGPAHKYLDYFHQTYQIISTEYVDKPDNKNLFYGAIKGMIDALGDPFTRFLNEDSSAELQEMASGKFVGIGVEIAVKDGEIVVVSPIDNSPALRAGIETGDIITRVNSEIIKDKNLDDIIKSIKGLPGTKVNISIKREGFKDEISYDIERAHIKIDSTEFAKIDGEAIGFLKIKTFSNDTTQDVKKALDYFNKNKIDKLIIDLRFNPGGLLPTAIEISDFFLEKELTIVSTKGRADSGKEHFFKAQSGPIYKGKIIVLVNKGSASASEILSGALRDNNKAMLLGEKTFGKASVQQTYNLDKDAGFALTVARYYTPSGAMIHDKGIKPDYEVKPADFPENETEEIKKISKDKLLNEFVSIKTVYNEKTKSEFKNFLQSRNIKISDVSADFLLKREIGKYHKSQIYDLEFDNQLTAAIEKLK